MGTGFDERSHVLTHQAALSDRDQLLGRSTLGGVEVVLLGHLVEVPEHSFAKVAAVSDLEEQPVQTVRFGRRMLVELKALILELEPAVLLRGLALWPLLRGRRKEPHHREPVM